MNILLINHYAGSLRHGMEYRPYYLSREWIRQGHSVTIAAASVSHVRNISPAIQGAVTEEMIDDIRYLWFKTPAYRGNGISRGVNIIAFVLQLLMHRSLISRTAQPGVVIASSTYPLDIIAAFAIARHGHAMLVFEVHDLWPLSPVELGGMSKYHPFILLMQWAENLAYRIANIVISVLPKAMEHMVQHGMRPEKFVHIPNGIYAADWDEQPISMPDEHRRVFSTLKAKGHFLVGYTGAHGLANALDHFIDAAGELQEHPVTFVLIGQGPEKMALVRKAQSRKQTNVIFLPAVEKKAMPQILQEMDALYIGLKADPLFRFGVSPNKLMDYLMSAKPVIYAIQAGNDIVAACGCGISIPPEMPGEIAQATLKLMNLSVKDRTRMGQRGREYVLKNHDYRVLARQFIESLKN